MSHIVGRKTPAITMRTKHCIEHSIKPCLVNTCPKFGLQTREHLVIIQIKGENREIFWQVVSFQMVHFTRLKYIEIESPFEPRQTKDRRKRSTITVLSESAIHCKLYLYSIQYSNRTN